MEYLLLLIPLACAALLSLLAAGAPMSLRGLALHPLNILGALLVLVTLDFYTLLSDTYSGSSSSFSGYLVHSPAQVRQGLTYFSLCSTIMTVALCFVFGGQQLPPRRKFTAETYRLHRKSSRIILILAVLVVTYVSVSVVAESISRGSLLHIAGVRFNFFRDNQLLNILYSVSVPAFLLYGSRYGLTKTTLTFAVVLIVILFPIGSRSQLIFIVLGLSFWAAQRYAIQLPVLYIGIPSVLIISVVYRYFARESGSVSSFSGFLEQHGGFFGTIFRTPDVSMAEAITAALTERSIERSPFESVLGMITAPIPRSLIPWKPWGASAEFTMGTDPDFWEEVRVERTVTGFVNLYLDFGYVFSLPVLAALAFVWGRMLWSYSRDRTRIAFLGPVLIICIYLFIRTDLYNVSLFLWPVLFVVGAHALFVRVIGLFGPKKRRMRPPPLSLARSGRPRRSTPIPEE